MADPQLPEDLPDPSILVGANAEVYIDGNVVAYINEIDIDENYNQTSIYAIGDFFPKTTKPMRFEGDLTGKIYILTDDKDPGTVKTLPDLSNIITHRGNLLEFREKGTNRRILRAICKLNSRKTGINTDTPGASNISMKILRIQKKEAYN
ncbi:hypothetical protein [Leptospira interrogans]|uniref:Uncharacterized protein n=1 Tax=Leptospira interrogans str. UI 12758 TaxID=1049938 RepID=A0A0E2DAN1_LEPIR|nr:hypothetical protein [Leptospira interrogans]EKR57180.1 hypothetical protein LEP1GSC105_0187 [Leptospira interrogans str. UI 12758]